MALGVGLTATQDAQAIIMRHDLPESDYIVDDGDYPALVDMFYPGDCIATLINDSVLITVAHCAEDLRLSDTLLVAGTEHAIEAVLLHPDYDGWFNDIALIHLTEPVVGVASLSLYRGEVLEGDAMTLVGRGVHATGLEGERGGETDGLLRRATNVVSEVRTQWIEVTFEEPGEAGITDLEGVGAAGDSGGPAFIETADGPQIAGLNSGGEAPGSIRVGQYGSWDYSTRVELFLDWVDANSVVPDPDSDWTLTPTRPRPRQRSKSTTNLKWPPKL